MQDENVELNSAERELESALKSLPPAAARIDPIAAAFAAGRRSSLVQLRMWQSVAAAMLVVAVGGWLMHVAPQKSDRSVDAPTVVILPTQPAPQPSADQSLIMLQRAVDENGVDGLPPSHVPAVRALTLTGTL